jgi:hypothetical protein
MIRDDRMYASIGERLETTVYGSVGTYLSRAKYVLDGGIGTSSEHLHTVSSDSVLILWHSRICHPR